MSLCRVRRIACSLALIAWLPALAVAQNQASTTVAIFYDGPDTPLSEGVLDARHIQNLLGHFGLKGETVPLAAYRSGQLAGYRAGFFAGSGEATKFPVGFLDDVRHTQQPFCWLGRHLDKLINSPEAKRQFGFAWTDYFDDLEYREVRYKGTVLPKEDPDLNIVQVLDSAAVQVLATARNDQNVTQPYVVRRNRFWYFADMPFSFAEEGGRYLVFCDLLHDILEIQHPASAKALVRIEDISTDIDPDDLRQVTDVLARRKVPFTMAVIPIYKNPTQGTEVRLTDRRATVDALQYMIAHGGTPVMHGVTHQYRGVSGDDYEFWNGTENTPIGNDSADLVRRKLADGLQESFAAGIFPRAFETPHYAASDIDYEAMKPMFGLFYERVLTTPDLGSAQYSPYATTDRLGRALIPENLSYLPQEAPDPKVVIAAARNLRVVRDGVASFYFHPFLPPALLEQVLTGITGLGYQFESIAGLGGTVNLENRYRVVAQSGTFGMDLKNEFWRVIVFDAAGKTVRDETSPLRISGTANVPVTVPADGWAALEPVKDPTSAAAPGWLTSVSAWLGKFSPRNAGADSGGFASTTPAWVLSTDDNDSRSLHAALGVSGYAVRDVRPAEFTAAPPDRRTLLAIPEAAGSRMTAGQIETVLRYLHDGGNVVADGHQVWLAKLGFQWAGRSIPVSQVTDSLFPEEKLTWQPAQVIERFTSPENAATYMVDPQSRQVLAAGGNWGAGRYLYLAAPLDQHTPYGTSHYPYFGAYLDEAFRRHASVRSARLEAYFDPGYRQGADLGRLISQWKQNGIRTVYLAAWQFYPRYQFDYAGFLKLAHQNGLAVYAWLVLPEVTPDMWIRHPEWRERTATGADGQVAWRTLMNLENPDCFRATMDWVKELLTTHEFDGVNLAELNYDADFTDYLRPDKFVPMNADVRGAFQKTAGFDPARLFEAGSPYYYKTNPKALERFLQYREDVVTGWHQRVLTEIAPIQKSRGWEVIVTMLDSLHSNYVRPALGINSRRIVALMKDFDFMLQVEDPAEHWTSPPDRYRGFAETYTRLVPDVHRLMFDVNAMPDRDVSATTLPSGLLTGMELASTVASAAAASGRVAIYSESTVRNQDWALIGEALASSARVEGDARHVTVTTLFPARLVAPPGQDYYLDGQLWPVASGDGVVIPPGRHELAAERPWYRFLERGEMPARLQSSTADLLEARVDSTGMALRYRSPSRALFVMDTEPARMMLDGQPAMLLVQARAGRWIVTAPRGEHALSIITTTRTGAYVNIWSWLSSSAITAFGALSTALMLGIYMTIRLRRLAKGRTHP